MSAYSKIQSMPPIIYDTQARNLIQKLIKFFGFEVIEKRLKKYQNSLVYSGPISREYYLKNRHPWWEALTLFFEIEKSGKSLRKHLSPSLKRLIRDALMISELQRDIPLKVKSKFKKDLLDDDNASAYLFELHTGWHFSRRGFEVIWYQEDGKPEFCVKTQTFSFDVECKRIGYDAARMIRRKDFYRFAEFLLPKIRRIQLKGQLDVVLNERLHASEQYIKKLADEVLGTIESSGPKGIFTVSQGEVVLNLVERQKTPVNFEEELNRIFNSKNFDGHTAIFAEKYDNSPVDPLILTMKSKKASLVLTGIKNKIEEAAQKQLDSRKIGIITCFLETIGGNDLHELATESGLQKMVSYVLEKEEHNHIAALIFCGEEEMVDSSNENEFSAKGLTFRNPNCPIEQVKDFPFLSSF